MSTVLSVYYALLSCTVILVTAKGPNIIIIGAGAAGIAAATKLLENGFLNITVLEASPQIGGRISTIKLGSSNVDLGAEWCEGKVNNIVYETVKDLHLLGSTKMNKKLVSSSGKLDEELGREILKISDDIYTDVKEMGSKDRTLGDYFTEQYMKRIRWKYGYDPSKLKTAQDALETLHLRILSNEGAFSWYDVASKDDKYEECEGDHFLNWKGQGYKIFLDILMKKYPDPRYQLPIDDKIKVFKDVTKISYDPESSQTEIDVVCSDGSRYKADHVILTPSVGVLKKQGQILFSPPLPVKKISAIKNIGFDCVMKYFMEFPEEWSNNSDVFEFVWEEYDKRSVQWEFPEGPSEDGRSWVTHLWSIRKADNNPKMYVAWFTGSLVPKIEVLTQHTLIDGIYYVMNKFLGHHYKIQKAAMVHRSSWCTDYHFRGAFSYQTIHTCEYEGGKCAQEILAEPILNSVGRPILQFAGEATHLRHHSTVHGAVETGYREAQRLIDLYK